MLERTPVFVLYIIVILDDHQVLVFPDLDFVLELSYDWNLVEVF